MTLKAVSADLDLLPPPGVTEVTLIHNFSLEKRYRKSLIPASPLSSPQQPGKGGILPYTLESCPKLHSRKGNVGAFIRQEETLELFNALRMSAISTFGAPPSRPRHLASVVEANASRYHGRSR